ncbi:MAG TPA: DEAD/DEAH box helicase, partial [Chthonomonadales bacterium]|nr:DEAD/DEAH box helicase [Chthonomonadales bacterium]
MFALQQKLVDDFHDYIRSFLCIRDPMIVGFLERELSRGALWPQPLLQLNPEFCPGPLVDELVDQGRLDPKCGGIFRRGKGPDNPHGLPLRLHRHQERALGCAQAGRNYVVTTGTGSGKSLCYILPVVDAVLREGSGTGTRAIVVYPMNALANSQLGELDKYLRSGQARPPVTYARYTGQEDQAEREAVLSDPPDILLTNFMMLELILTRPSERRLVDAAGRLRYLVLDELHTYRGRQGADVAMLVRRLRQHCAATRVQYIGTSATIASEGSAAARRRAVAEVASRLFGDSVSA